MEQELSHKARLEAKSDSEPLFVLKYQKRKMVPWVVFCLSFSPLIYYALFVHVYQSSSILVGAWLYGLLYLFFCVPFVTEMLLFKEIRLYGERIVKEWKLIGSRELQLAEVGLDSRHMGTRGIGGKYFFEQGVAPYGRALMPYLYMIGITYQESFADRADVKELNSLLAELSGRKVEEFEQTIQMKKLMKGEEPQRTVNRII